MKIRLYTDEEISKLKESFFIRGVKYKRELEYEPLFKLWTIMMKHDCPDLSASEIFSRAGIDASILHKKLPQRRIKEWGDYYKKFGIKYFMPEDEYYESIPQKKKRNNPDDDFKNKLMKYVVKRLGEIDEEENR